MNDLISRQEAIDAVEHITSSMSICVNSDECHGMKRMQRQAVIELANMPSAHSGLITWLLDEIWDDEMWKLNWQAFPELLCRKLEKLGYIKMEGGAYARLDR